MATIQINIGCTKGGADEQQDEGEKCQCGSRCTGTPGCFGSCGGEERSRGRVGMGSKPAEVANMPITTERSNTYDTTHVMIATPTAGEHAARAPPPQLTGLSAQQQGMLDTISAAAARMVGFEVGAMVSNDASTGWCIAVYERGCPTSPVVRDGSGWVRSRGAADPPGCRCAFLTGADLFFVAAG